MRKFTKQRFTMMKNLSNIKHSARKLFFILLFLASAFAESFAGNAPVAVNDTMTAIATQGTTFDVLLNDSDADGDINSATLTIVDNPLHGIASIETDMLTFATISYQADLYLGADSLSYTIQDSLGNTSAVTWVYITVQRPSCRNGNHDYSYSIDSAFTGTFTTFLQGMQGVEYSWDYGDGSSLDMGATATHVFVAGDTANVCMYVNDTLAQCTDTICKSFIVTDGANSCMVDSIDFTYNVDSTGYGVFDASVNSGLIMYNWDFGMGFENFSSPNQTHQFDTSGTYSVTLAAYDNVNQCTDTVSKSIVVTIDTIAPCNLVASFTETSDTLGNVQFTASPAGAASYLWVYGDGNIETLTTNTASHQYTASGAYSIILIIEDNGCSDTVYQFINVIYSPATTLPTCGLTASMTTTLGPGTAASFVAQPSSVSNFLQPYFYVWNFGDGVTDTTQNAAFGAGNTISHTYASDGTYNICVSVSTSLGTCEDIVCESIVINTATAGCGVTAGFTTTTDSAGVANHTASPAASAFGGPTYTYVWSHGDGTGDTLQSTFIFPNNTISHAYATSGTYDVCLIVTDSALACSDTICHQVTAFIDTVCNLTASYTFTQDSLGNVNYSAQPVNGGVLQYTYVWDMGDGTTLNDSTGNIQHTYANAGQYTVCLVVNDNLRGCTDTICNAVDVVIDTVCNLTASFTHTDSAGNVTFTAEPSSLSSFIQTYDYVWSYGDGVVETSQTGIITAGNTMTHNYALGDYLACVTVTDAATLCSNTFCDSIHIADTTVVCNLTASYIYTQDSAGTVSFTGDPSSASSFIQTYYYVWDYNDGTTETTQTGLFTAGNTAGHTFAAGTYNVCLTVIDSVAMCSNAFCNSITVTVDSSLLCNYTPGFTYVADSLAKVDFTAEPSGLFTNYTYIWNYGDGVTETGTSLFTPNQITHIYAASGTYNVCLTVNDSTTGCSKQICQSITVVRDVSLCNLTASYTFVQTNDTVDFTGSPVPPVFGNNYTYSWSFGDGFTGVGSGLINQNLMQHIYIVPGTYNACLTVVDVSNNCSDTYCQSITIANPACTIDYTYTISNGVASFSAVNPAGGAVFTWLFGDGTSATGSTATHTYSTNGNFTACLSVVNISAACFDSTCKVINVTGLGFNENSLSATARIYPNPFANEFTVALNLKHKAVVEVILYDVVGNQISVIEKGTAPEGEHTINFNTNDLSAGTYLVKISVDGESTTKIITKN